MRFFLVFLVQIIIIILLYKMIQIVFNLLKHMIKDFFSMNIMSKFIHKCLIRQTGIVCLIWSIWSKSKLSLWLWIKSPFLSHSVVTIEFVIRKSFIRSLKRGFHRCKKLVKNARYKMKLLLVETWEQGLFITTSYPTLLSYWIAI